MMPLYGALARVCMCSALAIASASVSTSASAQQVHRTFDLPEQDAAVGVPAFAKQADVQIVISGRSIRGYRTNAVRGLLSVGDALKQLLAGTGLVVVPAKDGAAGLVVRAAASVEQVSATKDTQTEEASTADIVVTAQKRSERIQDVPIAISAFTQETLDKQKIEAGPDLLKAVPNLTFSKSNFAGYNLEIRGIGTKAISVTTDPGVAINFNSSTLITNRFFEQEFFDIERIEVLRGPQGTLYGRNATGGVVNIISNKADLTKFDGYLKAEVGNFGSRRAQGAINVPIVTDVLGLRLAGAYTNRNGFTTNDITMNRIDGRDLYTTRATLSAAPSSTLRADLIWERFSENDSRARTAKQLCHRDPGPATFGVLGALSPTDSGYLSQGCRDGSLYDDDAFGVPNGLSLPYVQLAQNSYLSTLGYTADGTPVGVLVEGRDPYASTTQTRDLRRISSVIDPIYRAKANVFELNANWDVTDTISVISQTAYNHDRYYSTQDYNRFNTVPVFNSSDGLTTDRFFPPVLPAPSLTPGGYFDDPQLGPSNRLVAQDLITAKSKQFSQELRLATIGNGPLQGTAGANYTYYKNKTDYYVFVNTLTAFAQSLSFLANASADPSLCNKFGLAAPVPANTPAADVANCIYIDPNPLGSINGQGHNYFRSANRYRLESFGIFGDATYRITPSLKVIGGLRYNDDVKTTTPIPSQLLLGTDPILGGTVNYGYPADPEIRQHFSALTGRAGLQWEPSVSFTKDTMIYATYSRGYKAGGTNPPPVGFKKTGFDGGRPIISLLSYPDRFKAEFVNSFEIGAKNTLLDGRLTLNLTTYLYDFSNYQISQIIDRQAINENFDARMYGLEGEFDWSPSAAFRLNGNIGLQNAKATNKTQLSLDVIDRLQGNGDEFALVKPFIQIPSNCVVRRSAIETAIQSGASYFQICPGNNLVSNPISAQDLPNGGRGFYADVGGNQLPNAPHFTANVGAEYNIPFAGDWALTPRADLYHQSGSWARVYNDQIDRLRGWENVNVSLRAGNPELGLLIEAYVKNVFDSTPITDAFINSDDTGLTTNVFTFDPRIIGVNVTKKF